MSSGPSPSARIRPIAVCVIRRGDEILVEAVPDAVKNLTGYRPLGGGIEFGEQGATAAQRELQEEIGVAVADVQYVGMLENLFTYQGRAGHEIALVFEGRFLDPSLYTQESFAGQEESGEPIRAGWKAVSEFRSGLAPLYPDGLLRLLVEQWQL